jgi:hypothetical protein
MRRVEYVAWHPGDQGYVPKSIVIDRIVMHAGISFIAELNHTSSYRCGRHFGVEKTLKFASEVWPRKQIAA